MLHVSSASSPEFHPEKIFGAKCSHDSRLFFFISICRPIIWCILEPNIYHSIVYPQALSIYAIPSKYKTMNTKDLCQILIRIPFLITAVGPESNPCI
jgi:hypothetical protein